MWTEAVDKHIQASRESEMIDILRKGTPFSWCSQEKYGVTFGLCSGNQAFN